MILLFGAVLSTQCDRGQPPVSTQAPAAAVSTPPPLPSSAAPTVAAPAAVNSAAVMAPEPPKKLYIRPLGTVLGAADVAFVQESLLAFYVMDVALLETSELPTAAYYAPRRRYRAEKLLDTLLAELPPDGFRVLGLTAHDISTTKEPYEDWGILGLASVDGEACVISSFRTRRGVDAAHARIRLGKTAVHEIGHTLGLPHCPNAGCLMQDGQGSVLTTDTEYDLCSDCRAKLRQLGYELASGRPIPWPRPTP